MDEALRLLRRPPPTPYHALNPLTRASIALAATLLAAALDRVPPLVALLLGLVLAPALLARSASAVSRAALRLALPLGASAVLVNTFFSTGSGAVLATLGPLVVTSAGLLLGAVVLLRVLVVAGAVSLLALTTPAPSLAAELQLRGAPHRLTFLVAATLQALPALQARTRAVVEAQQARGLDLGGPLPRRLASMASLAGPVMLGTLVEGEERVLALEARGFSREGPRTVLFPAPEAAAEGLLRGGLLLAVAAIVGARVAGGLG